MKAIKIIYGNITKRINSGAKNYEDLINITEKIFQFKEGESFDLIFTKDSEEHILENDEQFQKLLSENEGNKPIKLKLEKNNINEQDDINILNENELKENLIGMALKNSIKNFNGDVYYKNELLSDIDKLFKENLKNFSKELIKDFENNSIIRKNNNISPTGDKIYTNIKCSNCLQDITIIKYECLICDNLILCQKCINVHSIHPLIMFNLSSNNIKNKNDIENYYKNKLQPKIEEEILNKIKEENELKKIIEQIENEEDNKIKNINQNFNKEININNNLINNDINVRDFNLTISLSKPPKRFRLSDTNYRETFTITNNSDYNLTNDDISLFPLLFDEELIFCQNEKIDEIKAKEKKEVSIDFFIENVQKQKYVIQFIVHNENYNNKINVKEFQYILNISQIPRSINQNNNNIRRISFLNQNPHLNQNNLCLNHLLNEVFSFGYAQLNNQNLKKNIEK